MRYLCLIYSDERDLEALSKRELDSLAGAALAYEQVLRASGHFVAANVLQSVDTATTLRVRNGRTAITDGPLAETTERLSGAILIEARDLNEAIRVAARIPPARLGCVEVRPVEELGPR